MNPDLVRAAVGSATASAGSVNRAWFATFVLAAVVILIIWHTVPGTAKLVVGKDGRMSTSKFQATMWTLVVVFALFSLLFGFLIVQLGDLFNVEWAERLNEPLGTSFDEFFSQPLDETYLLLLGLPLGTAVASKAITTNKVASGAEVKAPKQPGDDTSAVQELVGDDNGETDLGDFQYLLFNFLAVGYFLIAFMSNPAEGLPTLPDTLIGLTGVAAAAYIGKKGIYKEPPVILGVLPPAEKPGRPVTVYGQRLLTAPDAGMVAGAGAPAAAANPSLGVVVVINGHSAEIQGQPEDTKVVVTVPDLPPGPTMLKVIRPPGAGSEELPFTVLAP